MNRYKYEHTILRGLQDILIFGDPIPSHIKCIKMQLYPTLSIICM